MTSFRKLICLLIPLTLTAPTAQAKEIRMAPFSFELSGTWKVEGENTGTRIFAMASTEMYQPPVVMAEVCRSTKDWPCRPNGDDPFPYERPNHQETYDQYYNSLGCSGASVTPINRPNGVLEKRLVCKMAGYSLFIINNEVLWVAYMPAEKKSVGIVEFLDAFARSLKAKNDEGRTP